jgi:hypothetical protein
MLIQGNASAREYGRTWAGIIHAMFIWIISRQQATYFRAIIREVVASQASRATIPSRRGYSYGSSARERPNSETRKFFTP